MQALPGDILQHIADRLPGRNARRMGMTFSGARTAVARSLAARRPLDRKKERAALTLAKRNRDVMAVVTPPERAAAAGITNVPRSLAAALSPAMAGALFSAAVFPWPLLIGGGLKVIYDLLLLNQFRDVKPPEEV